MVVVVVIVELFVDKISTDESVFVFDDDDDENDAEDDGDDEEDEDNDRINDDSGSLIR